MRIRIFKNRSPTALTWEEKNPAGYLYHPDNSTVLRDFINSEKRRRKMREIKFRGKTTGYGEWTYSDGNGLDDFFRGVRNGSIDFETVELFTDAYGKDGEEIYEGDIVKKHDEFVEEYDGAIGLVVWGAGETLGGFGIELISGDKNAFYDYDGSNYSCSELEKIGNKFENPELLVKK